MVRCLEHGGCERDLTKIAIGLDRTRFTPHVGVFREGGARTAELKAVGVPIVRFPVESFVNSSVIRAARQFGAYVRENAIRIVHAFDVPTDLFAAPAARWYRVPVVITAQLSFRYFYGRFGRVGLRFTDRLSDAVVVNSRAVGNTLTKQYAVPREKIDLCHNGVDAREFHPGPGQALPDLENASVVVGSVCVMRAEKRMDWVVRAFAKVHQFDSRSHLLLVGSGPETPRLEALADELGIREVAHFVPGQAKVAPWLRTIDIYINSSWSESFPNALLEAMACGCFPIGSNVGGIPELISHGKNGLLFDSNDEQDLAEKLKLAVTDEPLRDKLRQCAAVTAHQQFSMRLTLNRTEALYERLLAKRGVVKT
ncbi:MAG: glycosyltransferase [Acidobacteriaceae bacterium]|nr:glycosyltransferase [Acidobacteriaceae bacterium]